jgi:hypothetical protein
MVAFRNFPEITTPMNWKDRIGMFIIGLLFVAAAAASAVLGSQLNSSSAAVKKYKKDFFVANQLKYGFLNGKKWSYQVEKIIEQRIDSFSFSHKNKEVLQRQVSGIMNKLVDQVEIEMDKKQEKMGDRIKMKTIKMFVDLDKVRAKIPEFSSVVVGEIEKSGNREKVRNLVKEKIHNLLIDHSDSVVITGQEAILDKYHSPYLSDFNQMIRKKTDTIEAQQRIWGYQLIGIMGFILLVWVLLIRMNFYRVYALAFMLSVLVSFVNLFTGINLPMLEIDARISTLDIEVLRSHVVFYNQVLFYQSKSILEVSWILISKGNMASIVIGIFILLFSVFFPAAKLIAASIYLFSKKKKNQFIKWLAFKTGKWSMTDVLVVAIFMAYIGFQSIINEQLDHITTRASATEQVNLMTTNRSNLQVGFIIFLAFVVFNLFLAVILKHITHTREPRFKFVQWWKDGREDRKLFTRRILRNQGGEGNKQ